MCLIPLQPRDIGPKGSGRLCPLLLPSLPPCFSFYFLLFLFFVQKDEFQDRTFSLKHFLAIFVIYFVPSWFSCHFVDPTSLYSALATAICG